MTKFPFNKNFHYTDSIAEILETQECYWLVGIVDSYTPALQKDFEEEYFFTIELVKNEEGGARFTISSEHYGEIVVAQEIPYTDIQSNQKWWLVDNCLMIPSDY